jgi:hypothetical protein
VGHHVPPVLSDGRKAGPQHKKSFAADTAASTGLSKRQINRLLADPKPKEAKAVPPPRDPINEFESVDRQVDRLMAAVCL